MCFPPCTVMKAAILRFVVLPANNDRQQGRKQGREARAVNSLDRGI